MRYCMRQSFPCISAPVVYRRCVCRRSREPSVGYSIVSVSISKSDDSYRSDFFYPAESLPGGGKAPTISFDTFTWDFASRTPSVKIKPGETYRLEMPLRVALSGVVNPGSYEITYFTTLQVLIGETNGGWSEFSPIRIPVSATASFVI